MAWVRLPAVNRQRIAILLGQMIRRRLAAKPAGEVPGRDHAANFGGGCHPQSATAAQQQGRWRAGFCPTTQQGASHLAQPTRRPAQAIHHRDAGQVGQANHSSPGGGRTQRQPAQTSGQREP
jgi:hypothetical protein